MHRVSPQIEVSIQIPLIHIVDVTAEEIDKHGLNKVGVLGTKPVMEEEFYRDRFAQHGIEAIAPNSQQCEIIDTIIFDELVFGTIKDESRTIYVDIMQDLLERGAQGIFLVLYGN